MRTQWKSTVTLFQVQLEVPQHRRWCTKVIPASHNNESAACSGKVIAAGASTCKLPQQTHTTALSLCLSRLNKRAHCRALGLCGE